MTQKKWRILGIGLAVFGIYALMTGGLVVSSMRDFGGQRNIRLVQGLKSDVWLAPTSFNTGVPLIFWYSGAGGPFGLRLQIWDESWQYQAIEITEVILEYHDGEVVRKNDSWSRQLKPYIQYNSSSSGVTQTGMLMLSDQIEGLVLRHADVKITLKGYLVRGKAERVPFEASESFRPYSRPGITTLWQVLASC